ncbi:MAG: O-antigen ligase family protein, partial [Chthoniobacterales bacterium]
VNVAIQRTLPEIPIPLLAIGAALLGLGWWMALNGAAIFDTEFQLFMPRAQLLRAAPASIDQQLSVAWMIRATLLIGIACFVADLSQRPLWFMRLWAAIAISGGSVALLGLVQKASGAQMVFWEPSTGRTVSTFFASYYYHANAGAFLNLALPASIGLALRVMSRPSPPLARAVWLTCALCMVLAVFANTSRAAQALGLALMIAIGIRAFRKMVRPTGWRDLAFFGGAACVVLLTVLAMAQASRLDEPVERWRGTVQTLSGDARWEVARVAWHAAPEAGWLGFGPGTFRVAFLYVADPLSTGVQGTWRFLHQDYLQTVLEWGWFGSALWAGLFFGGILSAIASLRSTRAKGWIPRRRLLLPLIVLALLSVAMHALLDFPLQIASIQLYAATYIGLCWASLNWKADVERRK